MADIVASLPPIAQLLGIDEESGPAAAPLPDEPWRGKGKRGARSAWKGDTALPSVVCASPAVGTLALRGNGSPAVVAAVEEARQAVYEERCAWERIRRSLETSLSSRSRDDVMLTLSHLRRFPFFAELSEEHLLEVVAEMELLDLRCGKMEVARVVRGHRRGRGAVNAAAAPASSGGREGASAASDADVGNGDHKGGSESEAAVTKGEGRHHLVSTLGHPAPLSDKAGNNLRVPRKKPRVAGRTDKATEAALKRVHSLHKSMEETIFPSITGALKGIGLSAAKGNGMAKAKENGEDEEEEEEGAGELQEDAVVDPLMILVEGKMLLGLPTANGMEYFTLLPGDAFGYRMLTEALPVGARYVTERACFLLMVRQRLPTRGGAVEGGALLPVASAIRLAEEHVFRRQMDFLANRLSQKLFETAAETQPTGEGKRKAPPSQRPHAVVHPELVTCARSMVPLRLIDNQLLAGEGEASDALFLVYEGCITVSRVIPLRKGLGPSALRGAGGGGGGAANGVPRNSVVMEIATLRRGELCGELGLIGYNPDMRPGEGTVWSDDYWRDALFNRFRVSPTALNSSNAAFLKDIQDSPATGRTAHGGSSRCDDSVCPLDGAEEDVDREIEKRALFADVPPPRMAALISRNASLVYRLDYKVCRETFSSAVVTRLREYTKGYPSADDLRDRYEQQREWDVYREGVYREAVERVRKR